MTWGTAPLPDGWLWVRLADIADVQLGKMLDAKKQTGLHPRKYLRNSNVQWDRVELHDLFVMDVAPHESDRYTVRAGDLLVCEGGEPGRCAVVPEAASGLAYQKALHRVRPETDVNVRYLAHVLRHLALTGGLEDSFTGSTIKHLPRERFVEIPVPLPPAGEQQRIVDALEGQLTMHQEVLAAVRILVGPVSIAPESRLGLLRRSLLQAAVAGRLTARSSMDESAELLLERVRKARAAEVVRTKAAKAQAAAQRAVAKKESA